MIIPLTLDIQAHLIKEELQKLTFTVKTSAGYFPLDITKLSLYTIDDRIEYWIGDGDNRRKLISLYVAEDNGKIIHIYNYEINKPFHVDEVALISISIPITVTSMEEVLAFVKDGKGIQ